MSETHKTGALADDGGEVGHEHPAWKGNPRQYQIQAKETYVRHAERGLLPWAWVTTECETNFCLNPACMTIHNPKRIAYVDGVCVYCGDPAGGFDHLLPEPSTGKALRLLVALVPACANCNNRINDFPSPNISDRRRRAQASIERGYSRLLNVPDKTEAEMAELGYLMRTVSIKNNNIRARVRLRLAWPEDDPFYDLRAFQKSGVEDPVSLGLCDEWAAALRPEYRMEQVS